MEGPGVAIQQSSAFYGCSLGGLGSQVPLPETFAASGWVGAGASSSLARQSVRQDRPRRGTCPRLPPAPAKGP